MAREIPTLFTKAQYNKNIAAIEAAVNSDDWTIPTSESASTLGDGTGPAQGRRCLNFIEMRTSFTIAATISAVMFMVSAVELIAMRDLNSTQKALLWAKLVVDGISAVYNYGLRCATFSGGRLALSDCAPFLGVFGYILVVATVVLEIVFWVMKNNKPNPHKDYVEAIGPFVSNVAKPSEEWLRENQVPNE
jgi:hypothetical protein